MAEKTLNCDGTDIITVPDWSSVVGSKTLTSGGKVGDLLKITRAHIEDAKTKGELTEAGAGEAYASAIMESMKNAIAFELGYPKAQLELCFLRAQIDKLKCDCENDTLKTESQVSLNAAQENKLACECCNASALASADIQYRMQQIEKSICDCENSSMLAEKQSELYGRQAEGFDDNANQKLYDSQLSAWSMVFADTDLETITPSITTPHVSDTYNRLSARLGSSFNAPCKDYKDIQEQPDSICASD